MSNSDLQDGLAKAIPEALNLALFAVDSICTVMYANSAARRVTADDGLFQLTDNVLTINDKISQSSLLRAVAHVSEGGARETFTIGDPKSKAPQFVCVTALLDGGRPTKEALVMASISDLPDGRLGHVLHELYRLSPSECSISEALVTGMDPEQISELRGAKVTTVRGQIATVMLKTRTRRTCELMGLLTRIAHLP